MSDQRSAYVSAPNRWVSVETDPTTQLTYVPLVDPAPLTVSVPGLDPTIGSVEVVVTNATGKAVVVSEIDINIQVGTGASLTQSTDGIHYTVSSTDWTLVGPEGTITQGIATYAVVPATGKTITFQPGDSIVVQLYQIETNDYPGTTVVGIQETLGDGTNGQTSFQVTTYPAGFFFNSLTVTALSGSDYVPVSQVPFGTNVKLFWNASIIEAGASTVLQSSNTGQLSYTPTVLGEWETEQPLQADTIFTIQVITTAGQGGTPLSASLSCAVAVQNPALVASSLSVSGTSTLTGAVTSGALTAATLTVNGSSSVQDLNAAGSTILAATHVTTSLVVDETVSAKSAVLQALAVSGAATLSGDLSASNGAVSLLSGLHPHGDGTYQAHTDGLVVGYCSAGGMQSGAPSTCVYWLSGSNSDGVQVGVLGGNVGVFAGDSSNWTKAVASNPNSFTLPVRKNTTWSVNCQPYTGNQQAATVVFYWIPFGTVPDGQTFERLGDAKPVMHPKILIRKPVSKAHLIGELADVIDTLAEKPMPPATRARLVDILVKMNTDDFTTEIF